MKQIFINKYGGTEIIEIAENIKRPSAQENQVVVNVHAASLNRIDSVIRKGYLRQTLPIKFPFVPGGDFAGVVIELGKGVINLKEGDEIYGQAGVLLDGYGSLAEFTLAANNKVAKKPKSISMIKAASLPLVGSSAIQAIEDNIKLQKGQKILIHSATGEIGSIYVQLAKHIGAYVAETVIGKFKNLENSLGVDELIDYETLEDTSITECYDAVLVTAGNTLNGAYKVIKKGGVLVSLAGDVDETKAKEYGITAITQATQANTSQLEHLARLVDKGAIKPIIDRIFSFNDAKEAFNYFEKVDPAGKVVIKFYPYVS